MSKIASTKRSSGKHRKIRNLVAAAASALLIAGAGSAYAQTDSTGTSSKGISNYGEVKASSTWDRVQGKPATATRWPTWNEVTNKPATFPPSNHNHDSRYARINHNHDGRYLRSCQVCIQLGDDMRSRDKPKYTGDPVCVSANTGWSDWAIDENGYDPDTLRIRLVCN